MRFLFVASIGLILYTYVFYPLLLLVMGGCKQLLGDFLFGLRRRNRRATQREPEYPTISIVFAAHNEEAVIDQKMRNCAAVDYPADRLEVLVGCDGCTDATAAIARGACLPDAVVHEFHERRGKAAVLNRLVPLARGTIVVLCDANTLFEPGTLKLLVRHFANRDIGCVCGELRLRTALGRPRGEALYWRYETALKFLESRFNMLVGANGAVMAVRKGLFAGIPPNGIVEDFLIAMRIRAGGHRVVYDPEAVAWEEVALKLNHEFRRRFRIGAGNFHALRYTWRMLNPAAGSIALSFWSHKVCRWLVPIALGAAQIASLSLARDPRYLVCAASLALMDLFGFIGYQLDRRDRHWRLFSVPYYFLSMNLALFFGFIRFLRGTQTIVWSPTVRDVAPAADWVADGARSQSAADTATTRGAGVA